MEIYNDSSLQTTVPKVSFAAGATEEGGRRSTGNRKPLTPHNPNKGGKKTSPTMQAFRKSLKEGGGTSSKGVLASSSKENNGATPSSARSFRRTLVRGPSSVEGKKEDETNPTRRSKLFVGQRLSSAALGPPKRVAQPKTPNSLLRSELDDDEDDEEESFLVSPPPGALWNVLESNKLVIVSPQAATDIQHQQQQKGVMTPFMSPPLKPRVLVARTTGKTNTSSNSKEKMMNNKDPWFSLDGVSSPTPKKTNTSGVMLDTPKDTVTPRMDLSTMFSDQKTKPAALLSQEETRKENGDLKEDPLNLAMTSSKEETILETDDGESFEKEEQQREEEVDSKQTEQHHVHVVEPKASMDTPEMSTPVQDRGVDNEKTEDELQTSAKADNATQISEENGLMDFTAMFSNSKAKPSPAPQHLAKRMEKREKKKPPLKTTMNKIPRNPNTLPQMDQKEKKKQQQHQETVDTSTVPTTEKISEPVSEENGLMDFSAMFSKTKTVSPPPMNLVKRMENRPLLKAKSTDSGTSKKSFASPKQQVQSEPDSVQQKNKDTTTGPTIEGVPEPVSDKNGLMDFSAIFSKTKTASPPPMNLAKRIENRPPLKAKTNFDTKARSKGESTASTHKNQSSKRTVTAVTNIEKKPTTTRRKHPPTQQATQTLIEATPKIKKPGKYAAMATPSARKYTPSRKFTPMSSRKYTPMSSKTSRDKKSISDDATNEWAEKQSETFVNWLNYTFDPSKEDDEKTDGSCGGLRMLIIHRRLAQARMRASDIFFGDHMQKVKNKIRSEIAKGRLSIRSDRDIYYDLSLRKQIKALLQSYTTPWLRLGFEVMFGESINVENTTDEAATQQMSHYGRMRNTLGNFIVNRLLSDPAVLMKYTKGKCKIPSGRFEKQFRAEIRSLVLYRIMVLIFFLDQAKLANVLDKVPRLFAKGSAVKSSREVLLAFCRECLSSEGDFIKHLSRIGLTVSYKQDPVDELDFNISNLATDLRDGTRLSRLTEIITELPPKSLMSQLRLPSISRLQKLHNLNVALCSLDDRGVLLPEDVHAHHIVDGHREMVLKLMWSVISHNCMEKLLEGDLLENEISNVIRSNQARRKVKGLLTFDTNCDLPHNYSKDASPEDILKSLLFRWCQAVCSSYGLKLDNFSSSFADGKALCFLVHYYHPSVIRLDEILPTSNDQQEGISMEQAIQNERDNSTMASNRASQLGGFPKMIPISDSKNPPNERSMLLCLTYLCSRLMESSKEIFATILIQQGYRAYRERVLLDKKKESAKFIFDFWSQHKENYYAFQKRRYAQAVAIVETFVLANRQALKRMKCVRLEKERQIAAAIQIQRLYRGSLGRMEFYVLWERKQASIVIQSQFRQCKAKKICRELRLERDSASYLQRSWRGFICRQKYLVVIESVILLQALSRGIAVRSDLQEKQNAALLIQNSWWECVERWERSWGATFIQRIWRGHCGRKDYEIQKNMQFRQVKHAATTIQSAWRGFSAQVQFQLTLMDIISLQSLVRKKLALKNRDARMYSIAVLQNGVRCWLARRRMRALLQQRAENFKSASVIQSHWRKYLARSMFISSLTAAIQIQGHVRGWLVRDQIALWNHSAGLIQCMWGTYALGRMNENATIGIQKTWRRHSNRRKFLQIRESIVSIQKCWRGYVDRDRLSKEHFAATILQSCWRGFVAKMNYDLDILEIIFVQSAVRRFLAKKEAAVRRKVLKVRDLEKLTKAVVVAQTWWRARATSHNYRSVKIGMVVLQALFRGRKQRQYLSLLNQKASLLQSHWRCFASCIKYRLTVGDIITVQSVFRLQLAKKKALHRVSCLLKIQSMARRGIAIKKLAALKNKRVFQDKQTESSIRIQSLWRGKKARELATKHSAARKIQKTWRCFVTHIDYLVQVISVLTIQASVRSLLAKKAFKTRRRSLIKLQAFCRGSIARKEIRLAGQQRKERAATIIQKHTRGFITRIEIEIENFAACEIQRVWRGYDQFAEYVYSIFAAIKIQSCIRGYLGRARYHDMKLALWAERRFVNKKVTAIQLAFRHHLLEKKMSHAASVIQVAFRNYIARFRVRMIARATICLQAAFRGSVVRRKRTKKVASIARKVLNANTRAAGSPNQRLGNRTSSALAVLQTSTRLAEIMDAVKTLEASTRLSMNCCEVFTEANAAKTLLDLIRACNRSLPHVELVHWILLTLENVGQYSAFLQSFSDCKSAEVFLDKVQMFRDKDGIFCLSVSLLRRIIVTDKTVLDFCGTHEHLKRLKGIHKLSTRRTGASFTKPKAKKRKLQKYERREVFERPEALKVLGELIEYIEMPIPSTARSVSQKRFVF